MNVDSSWLPSADSDLRWRCPVDGHAQKTGWTRHGHIEVAKLPLQEFLIGFYTMAIRPMTPKGDMPPHLVKRLPNTLPGFTVARLAVSEIYKGQWHGKILLMAAMAKAVAEEVGGFALFVDAKDGEASSFYQKYGFTPFPSDPLILVIPIAHIPG